MSINELETYFKGEKLYGDDLSPDEIEKWYADEKEGYAGLGSKNKETYQYDYHELNKQLGFRHLTQDKYHKVLGFGSAYGDEFLPIVDKIRDITILEPSDAFISDNLNGIPVLYVKPVSSGLLSFEDNSFDLITCFGVLHHIPNVTTVLRELHRCLKPGGILLLREPITSMGDWTKPRHGLTKRERGIPLPIFKNIIQSLNFKIIKEQHCMFAPMGKLQPFSKTSIWNSPFHVGLDRILSNSFKFNYRYHAEHFIYKIRPGNIYFVLTK